MGELGIRLDWLVKGVAGAIAAVWGGLIPLVQLLLILMLIDIGTGLLSAAQRREISSRISFVGMTKKALVLLVVAMAAAVESYAGAIVGNLPIDEAVAGFYCASEGISILENAVTAGLPVPQLLRDVLKKLSPTEQPPETAPRG